MKYKIPYRSVEVVWEDAASNSDSWISIPDISEPIQINTRGWLIKDEDGYVVVAASVSHDGEGDDNVGNTMTIPRGMILSIKDIKVVNARSKLRHKLHPEPGPEELHREQGQG